MALWAARRGGAQPIARDDWKQLALLGFVGYYLASLLDFMGLQHVTAAFERLVLFLYPTLVVLLSAVWQRVRITRRAGGALLLSYAGIALVFVNDLNVGGDTRAVATGGALVFGSALLYAIYLVRAGPVIGRMGSTRFIAWAMLVSTFFVLAQFALTRDLGALAVPARVHSLALAMALFSTVLPTWLIAEAIRRIGASASSQIGSLGPVFTIFLGALLLDEPVRAIQLAGAALVLVGVTLVSRRPVAAPAAAQG
jgi:drug/metabolite transporter (DMT)-like permease